MRTKRLVLILLTLLGGIINLSAQRSVALGSQVTSEANLQENVPYLIYQPRNATYVKEASDKYSAIASNSADDTGLFYFVKVSDGVYKIKSYSTGKYISKPATTGIAAIAPVDEADAGEWNLQFDTNGCIYPLCNGYGWDRGSNALWATADASTEYNESSNVKLYKIFEITTDAINFTFSRTDQDVEVSVTDGNGDAIPGVTATLYSKSFDAFMSSGADAITRTTNSVLAPASYGNVANSEITYTFKVEGLSTAFSFNAADIDVYAMTSGGTSQSNTGNTVRNFQFDVATGSTAEGVATAVEKTSDTDICTVSDQDGGLYHSVQTMIRANAMTTTKPLYVKVTLKKTSSLGCYAGIASLTLYTYVEPYSISHVYTINNTNTSRGALIYNPEASTKYVWSSGKSGSFDASSANCQWVIIPTGTDGQYYLYNVGAGKFAIPTGNESGATNPWAFSDNAVAVIFETQSDNTKKIKLATSPVSGTNAAYMAVSNGQTYPIINYNDVGGNFTITKVDGVDASTAAEAAIEKLVKNQTVLTAVPTEDEGWYVMRIKTSSTESHVGRYIFAPTDGVTYSGTSYPLSFTGAVAVEPSISDPTYYVRFIKSGDNFYWQLPNGVYMAVNGTTFPRNSFSAASITLTYDSGISVKGGSYWAIPYNNNAAYILGGSSSTSRTYDIYPIDLATAGLAAWKVVISNGAENTQLTCTRSDVVGLTAVYNNGYFFLPDDVTPASSDFSLEGMISCAVDSEAKTITVEYDPTIALLADGITIAQGYQTAGRGDEVILLRITATAIQDATSTTMTVNLKDGAEEHISKLTLYEASTNSPEILSSGAGAPVRTTVDELTTVAASNTLTIGDLSRGNHYYWLAATVKDDAEIGAILDAAVATVTYTCNEKTTPLDISSKGDPAARGAMVFATHSYPFLPRDNGSRVYRIPALVVADDGSIIAACDKRYDSHTDIGGGHVIDIVVRRSTDGGRTWGETVVVAKGDNSNDATCGYGDPSLTKGKDGKLYLLFGAGNTGYFYGLNRICMSVSEDNGITWSNPVDLKETGKITDHASTYGSTTCYGLYDYFVTSGKGLYTTDGILMYLLPAQPYTDEGKTAHTSNSQDYVFYSTDDGATWHISDNAVYTAGDEAKLEQANDGSLIASIRQGNGRGFNKGTYVKNDDGTVTFTWDTQYQNTQLHNGGNANNQDILYYSRSTDGVDSPDILLHTMTTGSHANLQLYMSIDGGDNWASVLQIQPRGARYATMSRLANGDLGILFEDQALNETGGYNDYNHYPINFLTITKEQILNWYEDCVDASNSLKIADGTNSNGPASYGDATSSTINGTHTLSRTWTSNAASGHEGLTLSTSHDAFMEETAYAAYHCLGFKPSAGNATDVVTITAPAGYIIKGYSLNAGYWTSTENYTLTASEGTGTLTCTTSAAPAYSNANLEVTGINKPSTTFTVKSKQEANDRCLMIKSFYVVLTQAYPLSLTKVGDASYATLYLPFDVTMPAGTKPYAVNISGSSAVMTEIEGGLPAGTPTVVVNESGATSVKLNVTTDLTAFGETNALVGTYTDMALDLAADNGNYSLGRQKDENEDYVIGFYKFKNGENTTITLKANRAYLSTGATPVGSGDVKGFRLVWGGEDAIESIGADTTTTGSRIYNIAGQRVSAPSRGLYIVNGQKVVVK